MIQDPLWQHAPAAYEAVFRPLDLDIRVSATEERLIELAARVLGEPTAARSGTGARPSMTLVLVAGGDSASTSASGRAVHRERDGMYAASVEGVGLATADLASGTGAVFIERAHVVQVLEGASPVHPAEVLIGSPVWRFAAHRGMVALHAGAVTGPLGTIVVRGPAGSGKSTTVLCAGRAGWKVLADEVVWFDPLVGPPLLRGTGAQIQLERDDGSKAPLSDVGAAAIEFTKDANLGCVVCLVGRVDSGPGAWHPLATQAAVDAFDLGAHPGENTQDSAGVARARYEILARGCYALTAGTPDTLADQLGAIAAHASDTA